MANIQLLDPYGNYRTQTDCGSGEGGECDAYMLSEIGTPGDWARETYLQDDAKKILPPANKQKPAAAVFGLSSGTIILAGIAFVIARAAMNVGR